MRNLVAACILSCVALTAACGDDGIGEEPSAERSAKGTTSAEASPASCDALTDADVRDLARQPLGEPEKADVGGLEACKWGSDETWVQLVSVPAGVWATQLPGIVAQVEASGFLDDPANRRKLERARDLVESGATIDPDQACEFFSSLLEIQGQAPGSFRTTAVIPTREDPQGISGQYCAEGRYTSVLLVAPDLVGSRQEVTRVERAVEAARSGGAG